MTTLRSMVHELTPEFSFAGFTFPKWVFSLPRGSKAKRLTAAKNPVCGPYYHAPKPGGGKGCGFYLESDGALSLRWQWADEVSEAHIKHTGWYSDEHGDSEKIRGLVFRLPKSRGFLAGWSMGEGMASALECDIYETEREAALAADSLAENVAEREREYQEEEEAKREAEEAASLTEFCEEVAA
jgi:hypothetical protein